MGARYWQREATVEERVSGDEAQQRQRPWRTAALRREWPLGSASSWRKRRSCRGGVWRRLLDACGAGRSGAGMAGRGYSLLSLAKQGRRRSRERALRAREREAQVGTTERGGDRPGDGDRASPGGAGGKTREGSGEREAGPRVRRSGLGSRPGCRRSRWAGAENCLGRPSPGNLFLFITLCLYK